jgi:hypothetical protein
MFFFPLLDDTSCSECLQDLTTVKIIQGEASETIPELEGKRPQTCNEFEQ